MARILLVDDDADFLKLAERLLIYEGYAISVCRDAVSAIDLLNSQHFDALVSDANMPHYTGYDLIRTVRKDPRFNRIAIAMLTGLRRREHIEKALKIGVDDYIIKPIDPLLFLKKIEALFTKKPPQKLAEFCFDDDNSKVAEGELSVPVRIKRISEAAMTIESPYGLPKGTRLVVQSKLFEQMRIQPPTTVVVNEEQKGQKFILRLTFVGAAEGTLSRIRHWIFNQSSQNPNTAVRRPS